MSEDMTLLIITVKMLIGHVFALVMTKLAFFCGLLSFARRHRPLGHKRPTSSNRLTHAKESQLTIHYFYSYQNHLMLKRFYK